MSAKGDEEAGGTLVGTGLEDAEDALVEAATAVAAHRAALKRGDVEAVERTLDLHAHGAGPRGVLSQLAAQKGVSEAVTKLVPFFAKAQFTPVTARVVDREEVEVYEQLGHPSLGRPMRTMSLVRRRGGYWRVVTTSDAPDEKLHLCLFCDTEGDAPIELDARRFNRAASDLLFPGELREEKGELHLCHTETEDEAKVVVVDPFEAGLSVTGPEVEELLIQSSTLASVSLIPSTDRMERLGQMGWLAGGVALLAELHAGNAVYLPVCDRILTPAQLRDTANLEMPTMEELGQTWVHFRIEDGWLGTRGMAHFMMPEIEVHLADMPDQEAAARLVAVAAGSLLGRRLALGVGVTPVIEGLKVKVLLGRRGPQAGTTYGRWGSRRLVPLP